MKKLITIGKNAIILGLLLWICETAWFGFNLTPINETEKFLDLLSAIIIYIGIGFYVSPLFNLYESKAKRLLSNDRYFIVFYNGDRNGKEFIGQSNFSTNNKKYISFLCLEDIEKILKEKYNIDNVVITGFNEVSKEEYDIWSFKSEPNNKSDENE